MQLIQFLAAWMFPGAVCFAPAVEVAATDSSELDCASSSSPSFSANALGANALGSGSSLSSPSSTSSSDNGHRSFFKSRSRQESPSTTPLCFGAGGGGSAGRRLLLLRGSRARAPAKQPQEEFAATMAPKGKGDVVGRYMRKISRRLRKARSDGKGSPSPMAAAADDTARERAEAVARAISYCKDTLRRGKSPSPSPPPPPPPSPSLDDWLQDRQEEIIASAAEQHCDEWSDPRPSPTRPRRPAGLPLGMQTMAKRFKESPCPCPCSASPTRYSSLAACAVAHGEESPQPHHGHGCRGESSTSSLDEMEFLKTFDGTRIDRSAFHHCGDLKKRLSSVQEVSWL